jgi:DNA polymerase III epsilon subunit-like protein
MKVIVYDTETTGLPKKTNTSPCLENESNYPYIVQLSYIIYDIETNTVVKIYDKVINIPDNIVISEESIKLHGITREIMRENGISIISALETFLNDICAADIIVGHNIEFDKIMVHIEMLRNAFPNIDLFTSSTKFYCTMKTTIELCAIKTNYKNSVKTYNKFPKLVELYTYLFSKTPTKLHNALNDVALCLQCFCKLMFQTNIYDLNDEIKTLIDNVM